MARVVTHLLFDFQPTDSPTFIAVVGTLALVAGAACFIPARRAAAIDPMHALRAD